MKNYNELYKYIVKEVYQKYNPEKIDDISSLFEKYAGKEKELTERICEKYNVSDNEVHEIILEYRKTLTQKKSLPLFIKGLWILVVTVVVIAIACKLYNAHKNKEQVENINTGMVDTAGEDDKNKDNYGVNKEQQQVVYDFIDCIKNQKKEQLIAKISFPFYREYPLPPIKNKEEFLIRYNEVFDDKLTKMIVDSKPSTDWSALGWRGIMLFNGEVWLDYDGRLIAVNYLSEFEIKKKDELINLDKSQLHESIKEFKAPVHVLETTMYRIRIDDLGESNYRYAAWRLESKMSDKPDIIIKNGEYKPNGSGGNHSFEFHNGEYTYKCAIIVLGEDDSPPAYLTIYKNDKEILAQEANIVTR